MNKEAIAEEVFDLAMLTLKEVLDIQGVTGAFAQIETLAVFRLADAEDITTDAKAVYLTLLTALGQPDILNKIVSMAPPSSSPSLGSIARQLDVVIQYYIDNHAHTKH